MRRILFQSLAVAVLGTITGCGNMKSVEKDELVGIFRANFGAGTNVLELRKDGTYTQVLHEPGTTLFQHTNRWALEHRHDKPWLSFYGFSVNGVVWGVEIERAGNQVRLRADPTVNHYFTKTSE